MSTKSSIKWKEQTDTPGYHLYDDVMDYSDEPPVYLSLDGVHAELHTQNGPGVSVTVTIPRATARELGLLPPLSKPVYTLDGKLYETCDCNPRSGPCKRGMERKLLTAELSRCIVPVAPGNALSDSGMRKGPSS